MVLLVLRMGIDFVVLRVLMGVHLLVLLVLGVGVHFGVLLMLPVRFHLVVLLLMRLQLVARGVGQHRLEQVRRLTGLVGRRVHQGLTLGLRMLLLEFGSFPRIWDFGALLRLLLEVDLGVRGHL